ncbi:MAG: FAD-dependent oxidoreductase [Deltaproteobacteria bacterium]|nr:FAD-dependent oxidoreductase [Deltaproteobacteria bacterium]
MGEQQQTATSWWMTTREVAPGPSLAGDLDVDVAIVGGGFTGLATAYFLRRDEAAMRIAVLESERIGFGASGRNGGFNMTLFGLTLGITALRFGKANAAAAHHYMERAVDTLRDLVHDLRLDCDYEHPGFLRVATSESYRSRIQREIELAHKIGLLGIEWIDADRLAQEVRSQTYLGAWWEPRCGLLNPAKLCWSWQERLSEMGVSIYERTPVQELARDGQRLRLLTANGVVHADKVVLATNAWSHFFPQLRRKQLPVWTHIVLTEPLEAKHLAEIGWQHRQGIEDARDFVHYYRLTADNRLLMGGRDVTTARGMEMDHDLNDEIFAGLRRDVVETFPCLDGIRFADQWGGPVSVPVDMAPAMGYAGDHNLVYSLGCVGHGVSLTHLNGRTAADLVLGKKSDLTDIFFVNRRTIPWPPNPLRAIAVKAILGYMHYEDRKMDARPGSR